MKRLPTARERTEELERASLSIWATLAAESKGRDRFEEPDRLRTCFQQDRDRVLASRAFQRLGGKTQAVIGVGLGPPGDGHRSRLAHSLEVAQVGRTVARALRLNEDLVEAIALAHDLGHPPFGPAGEEALSAFTTEPFRHNEQSLRVVETLERGGLGLNLTWEVRDGILHRPWTTAAPSTPEAQVVRVAHRIASASHDLDEALRAGLVGAERVPADVARLLGPTHGSRVATMVDDVVASSEDQPEVVMGPAATEAERGLREFLAEQLYGRRGARAETDRAVHCVSSLAVFYLENPDRLPPERRGDGPVATRVADFVSAMTDAEALAHFEELFLPAPRRPQMP